MKLIKRLNEELKETQVEQANPFKYLDVNNTRGINDILEAKEDFTEQQLADMKKLMKQYKSRPRSAAKMYRHEVGDDLEMLEYNPEEVEAMVRYIAKELNL